MRSGTTTRIAPPRRFLSASITPHRAGNGYAVRSGKPNFCTTAPMRPAQSVGQMPRALAARATVAMPMATAFPWETGLPIVSEIMSINHLDLFDDVDIIQVGARNAQNFELLRALGKTDKPILLKRGIAGTLKELLMSAEYIMSGGNEKIILCERGIRSYETFTRNTLDVSAIPVLHELTHLPVIADPSHATGKARLVAPMANAIAASGADGIMIEVHNDPMHALCDGAQSLTPDQFDAVAKQVLRIREVIGA